MTAWGDAELLVELLDRQFEYLGNLGDGTDKIVRLDRIVSFIQEQPAMAGVLEELRAEANRALQECEAADTAVRVELRRLWAAHGDELRRRLASVTDDAAHAYGSYASFEASLAVSCTLKVSKYGEYEEEQTAHLISAVKSWWDWAKGLATEQAAPMVGDFAKLGEALQTVSRTHEHHRSRLKYARRSLAWPAYERLMQNAKVLNPPLPEPGADFTAWIDFAQATEFAGAMLRFDYDNVDASEKSDAETTYEEINRDSKLLHEELRLRVGLNRSRLAMVQRYAARCEAFDAQRLRDLCASDTVNAERLLTLDFARYLFDAGLHPLIDSTVAGLRPDILDTSSVLFYVEAKQYTGEHPRAQLKKAYSQVWGTWGRLRKRYASDEAFLVVFRRSGPWVELPSVIRHDGLKLFSVVADISGEGGSREKQQAITLSEDEMRPQASDEEAE